jgi:PAS domain S-box-containing protein
LGEAVDLPTLSVIVIVGNGISLVLSSAMLFLVLWQAPRRRDNQLMALYLLTIVVWSVGSLFARAAAALDYDLTSFGYLIAVGIALNSALLFALVTHYAGLHRRFWQRGALTALFLFYLIFVPSLLNGQLYSDIRIDPNGVFSYTIHPLGYVALVVVYCSYLAALGVLWVYRKQRPGKLLVGSLFASIGALTGLLPPLGHYPIDVISEALAALLFAEVVLREQLFDPLIEANRQLAESEKRLRTIITNTPIILWSTDRHGLLTLVEGKLPESVAASPSELIGKSVNSVLGQDFPHMSESVQRALGGEAFTTILNTAFDAYEITLSPLKDETGAIIGTIGVAVDVTQRQQAEESLRHNEERYRTILATILDGYYELDLEGRLLDCNDAYCAIIGYPRAEVVGADSRRWISPASAPQLFKVFDQIRTTGQPATGVESDILRKDGAQGISEFSITLVKDEQGQPTGFRGIAHDITERKRTELELNQRMTELEILHEIEGDLTDTLDIGHRLTMALDLAVRLSRAGAGFIGLVEGELVRVVQVLGNYKPDMRGSYLPRDSGIVGRVMRNNEAEIILDVHQDPDYTAAIADTRALMTLPLSSMDRLIGVMNLETPKPERFTTETFDFLRLLTARIASSIDNAQLHQQTESQLEELQELYTAVRNLEQLKTQMIRIASHDLRSPIATMSGYLDLLKMDLEGKIEPAQGEFFSAIERGLRRMENITSEILSLERIEEAAQNAQKQTFDLHELVEQAVKEHREQANLKSQQLTLNAPDGVVVISGDHAQVHEAVANLISNAIKYTPEGGRVEVDLQRHDQEAQLEVRDTGYGIPEEMQARLFQPFFRAKTQETQKIDGTGLGLHLVKSIIERHGGRIVFHSVYGQGSTFGFVLPTATSS